MRRAVRQKCSARIGTESLAVTVPEDIVLDDVTRPQERKRVRPVSFAPPPNVCKKTKYQEASKDTTAWLSDMPVELTVMISALLPTASILCWMKVDKNTRSVLVSDYCWKDRYRNAVNERPLIIPDLCTAEVPITLESAYPTPGVGTPLTSSMKHVPLLNHFHKILKNFCLEHGLNMSTSFFVMYGSLLRTCWSCRDAIALANNKCANFGHHTSTQDAPGLTERVLPRRICRICITHDKEKPHTMAIYPEFYACKTWSRTLAQRIFALKEKDLKDLPYWIKPNPYSGKGEMRAYLHFDLLKKSLEKHGTWHQVCRVKYDELFQRKPATHKAAQTQILEANNFIVVDVQMNHSTDKHVKLIVETNDMSGLRDMLFVGW
jgi:hypothetical protein